jgi:FkbM family methyltransferase
MNSGSEPKPERRKGGLAGVSSSPPLWVHVTAALVRKLPAGRHAVLARLGRASRFYMRMPTALGGHMFVCDLRDVIAREVCFTGQYEPQETLLLRHILRDGMTFVDVGANWGYFTLLAAHLVRRNGRVLSLEPDPRLFTLLESCVRRNALSQVTLLQLAAGNMLGEVGLWGYKETDGNFGISTTVGAQARSLDSLTVEVTTLERVLDQHNVRRVDCMKIDIEGAEEAAIDGLGNALRTHRVARMLLELHPAQLAEQGSSPKRIAERLIALGYTGFHIDHSVATTRAVAYGRRKNLSTFVRPLDPSAPLDNWPHQLWLAPGISIP